MASDKIVVNMSELEEVGDETNIKATLVGNQLVMVIDTKRSFGLSSTGKMDTVAISHGFKSFPGKLQGNIYLGRKVVRI